MQAFEFQLDRRCAAEIGRKGGKTLRSRKQAKRQRQPKEAAADRLFEAKHIRRSRVFVA
jgi:hypothetical protein